MADDSECEVKPQKAVLVIACSDPVITSAVSEVLSTWRQVCVRDNKDALALVEQSCFDLVITGDTSSGREDVELLRKIRLVRPHTRLIIIADESTPADVIDAIRGRAFSYFTKPFSKSAFEEMLQVATDCPVWDDGIEMLSATDSWIRLSVRCDLGTANRVLQFIYEVVDLPEDEAEKVGSALRELLMNAIEHGGKFDPERRVEVGYLRARQMVAARIKDPGEGFSPKENLDTAANNPPDDPLRHVKHREEHGMRPGGYGVLLAKNLVDEVFYTEKGNEVLLIKYINGDKGSKA